jgi:hypothetical protein
MANEHSNHLSSHVPETYQSLPKGRFIRLAQIIYNAPNNRVQPGLSIKLTTFPLDQAPRFWALSYTWGPPLFGPSGEEPTELGLTPFECDGQMMEIGENLFNFLRHARDRGLFVSAKSTTSRTSIKTVEPFVELSGIGGHRQNQPIPLAFGRHAHLWVDALCINQSDVGERSHQVALMADIYKRCERVLVWLGPQEPNTDAIWILEHFVPKLHGCIDSKAQEFFHNKDVDLTGPEFTDLLGQEDCSRWSSCYLDIFSLFRRYRWFSRGWVVQEVCLKDSTEVAVICGRQTISWQSIVQLFRITVARDKFNAAGLVAERLAAAGGQDGEAIAVNEDSIIRLGLFNLVTTWLREARASLTPRNSRDVWRNIHFLITTWMTYTKFGDLRDHIYGCLGIMELLLAGCDESTISPDYNLSATDVLVKFTKVMLDKGVLLEAILGVVGPGSFTAQKNLPSWIQDVTTPYSHRYLRCNDERCHPSRGWDASLSVGKGHEARVEKDALILQGAWLDNVSSIGCSLSSFSMTKPEWLTRYFLCQHEYETEARARAVIRVITAGNTPRTITESGLPSRVRSWYEDALALALLRVPQEFVKELAVSQLNQAAKGQASNWLPTGDQILNTSRRPIMEVYNSLQRNPLDRIVNHFAQGRNLFYTTRGYLGYGFQSMRPNDQVWLIKGSDVPMILRKVDGRDEYTFLGGAYIDGIMYGSAVTKEFGKTFGPVRIV